MYVRGVVGLVPQCAGLIRTVRQDRPRPTRYLPVTCSTAIIPYPHLQYMYPYVFLVVVCTFSPMYNSTYWASGSDGVGKASWWEVFDHEQILLHGLHVLYVAVQLFVHCTATTTCPGVQAPGAKRKKPPKKKKGDTADSLALWRC